MSIVINSDSGSYSASYNPVMQNATSTNFELGKRFKYLTSIVTDYVEIASGTIVEWRGTPVFQMFTTSHNFSVGDILYLDDDANDGYYTGNCIVLNVPDEFSVILDLKAVQTYGGNPTFLYKTIDYKMIPAPNGNLELDISEVTRDYVSSNFVDSTAMRDASETRFNFDLMFGEEYVYKFEFEDNYFGLNGDAAFINRSLGPGYLSTIPFKVGDRIKVQQDLLELSYTDSFHDGLFVGFYTLNSSSGNAMNSYEVGEQIYIEGQISNPDYNGWAEIYEIYDSSQRAILAASLGIILPMYGAIVVKKKYVPTPPGEGGHMYGYPVSEYNNVCNVTDIEYDALAIGGPGILIHTNLPYAGTAPIISGEIYYADNRVTQFYNQTKLDNLTVFNSKFNRDDFTQTSNMGRYVLTSSYKNNNALKLSTILNNNDKYRVEIDSKGWILAHSDEEDLINGVLYNFKLNDNTTRIAKLRTPLNGVKDYFMPLGLEQLLNESNEGRLASSGGAFSNWYTDVKEYTMSAIDDAISPTYSILSQAINFKINDDCSMYAKHSVIFRDKMGSYITIPFIYRSINSTEVASNDYYKTEGKWTDNKFHYDSYDRGNKSFFSKSKDKLILTSGWLDDYENELFKDLVSSTEIFIQYHNEDDIVRPVTLAKKEITFSDNLQDQIFNYKLEFQVAYDEIRY